MAHPWMPATDARDSATTPPPVTCSKGVDAGLLDDGDGPGQTLATGTVSGAGLSCSICNVGAVVGDGPDDLAAGGTLAVFYLASGTGAEDQCTTPSGVLPINVGASLAIGSPAVGVYRSSDVPAGNNNSIDLAYALPLPPGTNCGDAPGAPGETCPAGCSAGGCFEDGDGGILCSPCSPDYTQDDWGATLISIPGEPNIVIGSWTITLTSVVPTVVTGDAGFPPGTSGYPVHGTILAKLVLGPTMGTGASDPTTTLSLSF